MASGSGSPPLGAGEAPPPSAFLDEAVTASTSGGSEEHEAASPAGFQYLAGWPIVVGEVQSAPRVADVDANGSLEVVVGSRKGVYAIEADGAAVPGWPVLLANASLHPVILADIEGDGRLAVFARAGLQVHGLRPDGTAVPGWPQQAYGFTAAAAADVDLDGKVEIAAMDRDGVAHLWNRLGIEEPGWPFLFPTSQYFSYGASALGDVDGDGRYEVAIPNAFNPALFVLAPDGSQVGGFTTTLSDALRGVSMADIDRDGRDDLIFVESGNLWVVDAKGTALPGFPVRSLTYAFPPAIGDLDGDGRLEIVAAGYGKVGVHRDDGTPYPGIWPRLLTGENLFRQPTIGDIDGDGAPDILVPASNRVYAWHADGTPVFTWSVPNASSVTITDLDLDGKVDLLVGTGDYTGMGRVYALGLQAPYDPATMEWPTQGHDAQGTNRYTPPRVSLPMQVRIEPHVLLPDGAAGVSAFLDFSANADPADLEFRIEEVARRRVAPLLGTTVASHPPGSPGPDRIVTFDGAALAAILRETPPPPSGFLELEIVSEAVNGRRFSGSDVVRTVRSPNPEPDLVATPDVLDLGDVMVGVSITGVVNVHNAGEARLEVREVRVEGSGFDVDRHSAFRVDAGATVPILVTFAPVDLGPASGTVTLVSNDPRDPERQILLEGVGFTPLPDIAVEPSALTFGTVAVGFSRALQVIVKNLGPGELDLTSLSADDPAFTAVASFDTLIPFGSAYVLVTFAPAGPGVVASSLRVGTNDPDEPEVTLPLSGTGQTPVRLLVGTASGDVLDVDEDGHIIPLASTSGLASDVESAPDGSAWVVGYSDNTLWHIEAAGVATQVASAADGLSLPSALAFDAEGALLIANVGTREILAFEEGVELALWREFPPGVSFPTGMALLPSGEVAICDACLREILAITAQGATRTLAADPSLWSARGCATGPDGNLYAAYEAQSGLGPSVRRIDANGRITVFADLFDGLSSTSGIAVDSHGRVHVADVAARRIHRFAADGTRELVTDLSGYSPHGLAVQE
jgi:hypothetical protein